VLIELINPLPRALAHYEAALAETLRDAGLDVRILQPAIETGSGSRFKRGVSYLRTARRANHSGGKALLLWPVFGYLELVVARFLYPATLIVFHDATPLRSHFGMSRVLGKLVGRSHLADRDTIIVHSKQARDALVALGWASPRILPLPLRREPAGSTGANPTAREHPPSCLVIGQFKPTRSVGVLARLPSHLSGFRLRIVGHGWPATPGWEVVDRFVSEEEFTSEVERADVVLIPYLHYFQSGVASRAFELGTAVVTPVHEQTADLFGLDWCGMARRWEPEDIAIAIRAAAAVPKSKIRERMDGTRVSTLAAWAKLIEDLTPPGKD
jgi:hypothetical protein